MIRRIRQGVEESGPEKSRMAFSETASIMRKMKMDAIMSDLLGGFAGRDGQSFEDLMMRGLNVVTTAMLAGTTAALLLGTAVALRDAVSPAPERVQSEMIRAVQDGHGAYAGGVADGMIVSGARIPEGTRALLQDLVPQSGDRSLRDLRLQGMGAGLRGEFGVEALHDYALFVRDLPDAVRALCEEAEARLALIAGEAGPPLARMAVLAGLLSESGGVMGVEMRVLIRTLALEVPSPEVERALTEVAHQAVGLRERGGAPLPEAGTLSAHLSERVSREPDRLVRAAAQEPPAP